MLSFVENHITHQNILCPELTIFHCAASIKMKS